METQWQPTCRFSVQTCSLKTKFCTWALSETVIWSNSGILKTQRATLSFWTLIYITHSNLRMTLWGVFRSNRSSFGQALKQRKQTKCSSWETSMPSLALGLTNYASRRDSNQPLRKSMEKNLTSPSRLDSKQSGWTQTPPCASIMFSTRGLLLCSPRLQNLLALAACQVTLRFTPPITWLSLLSSKSESDNYHNDDEHKDLRLTDIILLLFWIAAIKTKDNLYLKIEKEKSILCPRIYLKA